VEAALHCSPHLEKKNSMMMGASRPESLASRKQATREASATLSGKKKMSNRVPLVQAAKRPTSPGSPPPSKTDGKARPPGEASAPLTTKKKGSKPAVNKGRYSKDGRCPLAPRDEESAQTREKKPPHIPGPASKENVLITGRKHEQARQTQDLPDDLDDWAVTKQATEYLWRLPVGAAPGDEDFWDYCDEEQLAKLNQRLALYRLKDHTVSLHMKSSHQFSLMAYACLV
jgi:hypothetical protein